MPTDNSEIQFSHQDMKPFEPWLSRSTRRQQAIFEAVSFFFVVFFATLSIRAVWELHSAGYSVLGMILSAGIVATGLTIVPLVRARARFKSRRG